MDAAVAGSQFLGQLRIAQDGAGKDHGEEGEIEGEIERIPGRLHLLPGDVNQIGNGLEGEKGDADRPVNGIKGQLRDMESQKEGVEVVGNKVCVLEKSKHGDIEYYPEDEDGPGGPSALMGREQLSAKEVGKDRGKEGQDIDSLSPGIEEQTGEQKQKFRRRLGVEKTRSRTPGRKKKRKVMDEKIIA